MEAIGQEMVFQIHLVILSIAVPASIGFVWKKFKCIDKIDQRSIRHSKAWLVYVKMTDDQANRERTEYPKSENFQIIEKLLKDENGNL